MRCSVKVLQLQTMLVPWALLDMDRRDGDLDWLNASRRWVSSAAWLSRRQIWVISGNDVSNDGARARARLVEVVDDCSLCLFIVSRIRRCVKIDETTVTKQQQRSRQVYHILLIFCSKDQSNKTFGNKTTKLRFNTILAIFSYTLVISFSLL